MKQLTIIILLCLIIIQCRAQTTPVTGKAVISGKLSNCTENIASFRSESKLISHQFAVNSGEFADTIELPAGYYSLGFMKEYASLYFEPGFDIKIEIDMMNFDGSITFSGKGAAENQFLAQSYLNEQQHNKQRPDYDKITEKEFVESLNVFMLTEINRLNECKDCSENFKKMQSEYFKISRAYTLIGFPWMKMMKLQSKEPYILSDSFPDPYEGIDFNNQELIGIPSFSYLVQNKFGAITNNEVKSNPGADYNFVLISVLDSVLKNELVREKIIYDLSARAIDNGNDKEKVYKLIMKNLITEAYKSKTTTHYLKWTGLKVGNPSPEFELKDSNGQEYKLADFKGKYVYIDIWATWCMPCIGEIPELKKLTNELQDKQIAFVSIAWNDNKNAWESMIKEKDLQGIQLFADDSKHSFFEKYVVNSIPRFILLDKEGMIINPDAIRPTNPELKKLLDSLL